MDKDLYVKPNQIQQEILDKLKEVGIEGHVGTPHLDRDHDSLIIPNKKDEPKYILNTF